MLLMTKLGDQVLTLVLNIPECLYSNMAGRCQVCKRK